MVDSKFNIELPLNANNDDKRDKDIIEGLQNTHPPKITSLSSKDIEEVILQYGRDKLASVIFSNEGLERFNCPVIVVGDLPPIICIETSRNVQPPKSPFTVGWGSPFGSSIRYFIALHKKIPMKQAVFIANTQAFNALSKGMCYLVTYHHGKPAQWFLIDYAHENTTLRFLRRLIQNTIDNHKAILAMDAAVENNKLLKLWAVTEKSFGPWLKPADQLQISWINRFWDELRTHAKEYKALRRLINLTDEEREFLVSYPAFSNIYQLLKSTDNYSGFVQGLIKKSNNSKFIDDLFGDVLTRDTTYFSSFMDNEERVNLWGFISYFDHLWRSFPILNWDKNEFGLALPYFNNRLFESLAIDPISMKSRKTGYPAEFWQRYPPLTVLFNIDRIIDSHDIWISNNDSFEDSWSQMRFDRNPSEAIETAELLIEEAYSTQTWTIPTRANVIIEFGPFTNVELTQILDEVYFVWRNNEEEIFMTSVGMSRKNFWVPTISVDAILNEKIEAEFKLLMTAIARDFLVVEERQKIFDIGIRPRKGKIKGREVDHTRIIYLPRRRYVSDSFKTINLKTSLDLQARSKHYVRSHARKARPSLIQIKLAEEEKFELPDGHTFVRGHYKGKVANNVIYKSRSALDLLYETTGESSGTSSAKNVPNWFQFEKDMSELLNLLGYKIVKSSQPGYAGGRDIFATKKSGNKNEDWLVQCKYYTHTVGVSVIEQLLGSIAYFVTDNEGSITRGMVVATSSYSDDAIKFATKHGIQILDGEDIKSIAASLNKSPTEMSMQ